jgi:hypothetical protein
VLKIGGGSVQILEKHLLLHVCERVLSVFKFKLLHKQVRQPKGNLSNVLSRLAVGVRVDGDELELELELELDSYFFQ